MIENLTMDRAMEVNDEDMLLRTLSYFELCRELSADPAVTATPSYRLEANHVNADNEIHSSFFSTQSQQNNIFRQPCSLIGEANSFQEFNTKGIKKTSENGASDKRKRTLFTPLQLSRMEEEFRQNMYVVGLKRWRLATELSLTEKQIKIWFQNRRMKLKREQVKSQCLRSGFPWY